MVESRGGGGGGRVGTRRDVDGARQPSRPAELTLRDRREVKFHSNYIDRWRTSLCGRFEEIIIVREEDKV